MHLSHYYFFFDPQRTGTHARAKTRYDQRPGIASSTCKQQEARKKEAKQKQTTNNKQHKINNDNTNKK